MSSQPRIEIHGQAPFKQSGVYEVQISITNVRPSDDEIRSKQFSSMWHDNFHLKVKDGIFSEIIGTSKNPLPSSVDELDIIWIVVIDLFSSLHSVFDVKLKTSSSKTSSSASQNSSSNNVTSKKPTSSTLSVSTSSDTTGKRGATGDKGTTGDKG
ncbi:MAG: collagen-like protein, partial [Nitrosopumilus sp.]|nr:collagen-like protein [Nitrosopumilus sp.]